MKEVEPMNICSGNATLLLISKCFSGKHPTLQENKGGSSLESDFREVWQKLKAGAMG